MDSSAYSRRISRSPIVIREIIAIGDDLKRGVRSIKEIVVFDEEEITEEMLAERVASDITGRIDELNKHYKKAQALEEKLAAPPAKTRRRPRSFASAVGASGREKVRISLSSASSASTTRNASA